jgi:hypothetical protein
MCGSNKNAFLLFEVLISGVVLAIWLGSLTVVLTRIQHEKNTLLKREKDLDLADAILAKILAGQPVDEEAVTSHLFVGGLRLVQIPVGENQPDDKSYWVVVP